MRAPSLQVIPQLLPIMCRFLTYDFGGCGVTFQPTMASRSTGGGETRLKASELLSATTDMSERRGRSWNHQ